MADVLLLIEPSLDYAPLLAYLTESLQLDSWAALGELHERDFAEEPGQRLEPRARQALFFLVDFMQSTSAPMSFVGEIPRWMD